jgi:fumarylacetoacetase
VGLGNELGEAVPIAKAEERLFGISLLNDWSARDLQIWEAQPLGPFLGKNFATSVSAWVMPLEALEPYRVRARVHHQADPNPLNYLSDETVEKTGAFDATLEVWLSTAEMRVTKKNPVRVSQVNAKELYWTFAQMVAHHTSNGCNLVAGDVLGSGTVSGREADSAGCLLEMTECGAKPLQLPNGEVRKFLEDGDEVILRGFCEREGFARLSLGECRGLISPARTSG